MTHDFDTGLGIGGAGRHDLEAEARELVARGEMRVVEPTQTGPLPEGQLWEPCHCGTEPVCSICFKCREHCTC